MATSTCPLHYTAPSKKPVYEGGVLDEVVLQHEAMSKSYLKMVNKLSKLTADSVFATSQPEYFTIQSPNVGGTVTWTLNGQEAVLTEAIPSDPLDQPSSQWLEDLDVEDLIDEGQ